MTVNITVAGIGAVAVDTLLYVDRAIRPGKGRLTRQETAYGGNVATALVAVTALGGRGEFLGCLPDRASWPGVHEDLDRHGVITARARQVISEPIRSTVLVGIDGERFIAFDDSALAGASPVFDAAAAAEADVLLVDGYTPLAVSAVLPSVRQAGVPVVADLEFIEAESGELLDAADHLVIPLGVAAEVSGTWSPADAIEQLWSDRRRAVVVTDGARGAWFASHEDRQVRRQPAYRVEVVDTNGCGDVFHGAYSLAIARGATVAQAVSYASAAAAICATGRGGRGQLPTGSGIAALNETLVSIHQASGAPLRS